MKRLLLEEAVVFQPLAEGWPEPSEMLVAETTPGSEKREAMMKFGLASSSAS